MKKLFTLFLALVATTAMWAYDFQIDSLCYNITSNVEPYSVQVACGNYSNYTTVIVPDSVVYDGITYRVTSIEMRAFQGIRLLTSVTIGRYVSSIEEYNFYQCDFIKSLYIKATTPPVLNGGKIFISSRPTCYIPHGTLDAYKASGWAYLVSEFVEQDEEEQNENNKILYTTTNGKVIKTSGSAKFGANIVSNTYEDGQGVITFDGPVTTIGNEAFFWATELSSITLPNSITSIENSAFYMCRSLTSITIPSSVTSVGFSVFEHCSSMKSLIVELDNPIFDSRENCNAIIETATNTLVSAINTTIIPETVTTIKDYAFNGCSEMTSITIPNSVLTIGNWAFLACYSLQVVHFGTNIETIGEDVFYKSPVDTVYIATVTPPARANMVFTSRPICYVPCEAVADYQAHEYWGKENIQCMSSDNNPTIVDNIDVKEILIQKMLIKGQLFIRINENKYNILGYKLD